MKKIWIAAFAFLMGANSASASSSFSISDLTKRVNSLEVQAQNHSVPMPPMPIAEASKPMQVAQSAGDLAVRVDRLEQQMRQYTGQMEELNFRIRQLQEQLQRFQEDSEFRFQDLEKGSGNKRSSNAPITQQKPVAQQFEQLGTPPQNLGSLSQNQVPASGGSFGSGDSGTPLIGAGPIDLSSMMNGASGGGFSSPAAGGDNGAGAMSLSGDPSSDYDAAYGLILQGNYPAAEQAFQQFVSAYGQHELTANAYFWMGEAKFQQGQYREAIEVFLDSYSQFPNSQKAPDMLLRTGMSLHQINERDAACATFEELLQKFPNASSAIRQKVMAEIQSAKC